MLTIEHLLETLFERRLELVGNFRIHDVAVAIIEPHDMIDREEVRGEVLRMLGNEIYRGIGPVAAARGREAASRAASSLP